VAGIRTPLPADCPETGQHASGTFRWRCSYVVAWQGIVVVRPAGARLALDTAMNQSHRRVLIVEDEQCIRDVLVELFETDGVDVSAAASLDYAKWVLGRRTFDLVVTDIRLGGRRDGGLQVMAAAGMLSPEASVIALTAFPDDDNRLASLRLGAAHFLEKPVALERIAELAARAGVPTAFTPGTPAAQPM
jgi:two-component system, response regulator, stage 0 sporulation protein F